MNEKRKAAGRPAKPTLAAGAIVPAAETIAFVPSWDELARVLTQRLGVSVSTKSLENWRNHRKRPDLEGLWPACKTDGRKDVAAWMKFMREHGLHRADENISGDEFEEGERKTIRDWKEYETQLRCCKIEREIARGDGLLLVATDLEIPIGATFASIQTKLSQFPARVARFIVNLRDETAAEEKLRDEMDAVLTDLNLAAYLDGAADEVASRFPFNEECAALYAKVSFAGQDRATFVELVRLCCLEALRGIGARVLDKSPSLAESGAPPATGEHQTSPKPIPEGDTQTAAVSKPRRKSRKVTARRKPNEEKPKSASRKKIPLEGQVVSASKPSRIAKTEKRV